MDTALRFQSGHHDDRADRGVFDCRGSEIGQDPVYQRAIHNLGERNVRPSLSIPRHVAHVTHIFMDLPGHLAGEGSEIDRVASTRRLDDELFLPLVSWLHALQMAVSSAKPHQLRP